MEQARPFPIELQQSETSLKEMSNVISIHLSNQRKTMRSKPKVKARKPEPIELFLDPLMVDSSPTQQRSKQAMFVSSSENDTPSPHDDADEKIQPQSDQEEEYDDDDMDDMPLMALLMQLEETNEDITFGMHGYEKVSKICDSLQGDVYKARVVNPKVSGVALGDYVAIKRSSKELLEQKTAIENQMDDTQMTFCVAEDIVKEAKILKFINNHRNFSNYVVKYVDFFESDTDYYLVTEYIDGYTMRQFVEKAHDYIAEGVLGLKDYSKAIKFIMWQLSTTLHCMHDLYDVCHLDLNLDNIMLTGVRFLEEADGSLKVDSKLAIKLIDFGVSERFDRTDEFQCIKSGLSIDNELYLAPKAYAGDIYDARATDIWAMGMMFYASMMNSVLYEPCDLWNEGDNGYDALIHNNLKRHLLSINAAKYFQKKSFDFLNCCLQFDEEERATAAQLVQHKWFSLYYNQYEVTLKKRFSGIRNSLEKSRKKHKDCDAPSFYVCDEL